MVAADVEVEAGVVAASTLVAAFLVLITRIPGGINIRLNRMVT